MTLFVNYAYVIKRVWKRRPKGAALDWKEPSTENEVVKGMKLEYWITFRRINDWKVPKYDNKNQIHLIASL